MNFLIEKLKVIILSNYSSAEELMIAENLKNPSWLPEDTYIKEILNCIQDDMAGESSQSLFAVIGSEAVLPQCIANRADKIYNIIDGVLRLLR